MTISRRELLQMAALGLAAAGCSRPGADQAARRTTAAPSGTPSSAPASPSATTSGAASSSGATRVTSASELVHGRRSSTAVALTFHGAGDPAIARAVLRELAHAHVHVTVLAVGTWLDDQPAMARRVLDGGHELGNHTQHHLPMRGLGPAAAHREIVECAHRLRQLTGSQGRWFRASGTQHTTRVIRTAAAHAGYARCLSYDVDSLDWTDPGPDAVVRAVLDNARGGSIISLHLGHRGTIAALPPLIDGLGKKGLWAQSVTELVG
ncbi:MAG: polysaccharide deacetylase family protein [Actinomycetes bacterium]